MAFGSAEVELEDAANVPVKKDGGKQAGYLIVSLMVFVECPLPLQSQLNESL